MQRPFDEASFHWAILLHTRVNVYYNGTSVLEDRAWVIDTCPTNPDESFIWGYTDPAFVKRLLHMQWGSYVVPMNVSFTFYDVLTRMDRSLSWIVSSLLVDSHSLERATRQWCVDMMDFIESVAPGAIGGQEAIRKLAYYLRYEGTSHH